MSTRTAKLHSTCEGCGGTIYPNDEIVLVGGAWEHADCDASALHNRPPHQQPSIPQSFPKLERPACPVCHLEVPVTGECC